MKNIMPVLLFSLFFLTACTTTTEPENKIEDPIKDTVIVRYDSLGTFPYSQTLMVSGYANNIYIYGSHGKYSVYNTTNKSFVHYSNPADTISWRWDGAFVTVDTVMYIFAVGIGTASKYSTVITFNPNTHEIKSSGTTNPFALHMYPASAVVGNTIFLLYPSHDSLYVYNSSTQSGHFVSQNKLKNQFNEKVYSSGIYEDGFYVYSNKVKQLYKIHTATYLWEEIVIPDSVKSNIDQYALGGLIGNKFCLFNQRSNTGAVIAYNLSTKQWLSGKSNTSMDISEPYFYSTGTSLYMAEVFSKTLWKISLTN